MSFVDPTNEHPEIQKMNIAEFRRAGYLQEVNRQFLHPLGLALTVSVDDKTGEETLSYIWDYRDDPEGIYFDDSMLDPVKAERIRLIWQIREKLRIEKLGYMVQPIDG